MAINDRRNRGQPRNPSAGPRGAGIGTTPATPRPNTRVDVAPPTGGTATPLMRSAGPAPAPVQGPGTRSRMQGGNVTPGSRPGQSPVQPGGRSGPPVGVGASTPRLQSEPRPTPAFPDMPNPPDTLPETPGTPVPAGTFDAPEPNPQRADPSTILRGDVGTQAGTGVSTRASQSSAQSGRAGAVPSPGDVRQIMQGLGINTPADAPQAEVAPVRGADTRQTLRNNVVPQQQQLYDRFLQVQDQLANAEINDEADFTRVSQLQSQAGQLSEALGLTTRGAASTFTANRGFDQGVQTAGINANADAATTNAINAARLGISENSSATAILGDLLDNREAETRAEAGVAAARASNAPTAMERLQIALAKREAQEGSFENVANMAFGRDVFGENVGPIRDEMGNLTGLWRNRDGSTRPPTIQEFNLMQRFAEGGGDILDVRGPGVGGQ